MLAKRLKYLREERNLTQKELAEKLGISPSAIGMYESDKRNPDTYMLNILANFFNVSVDYILGRTNVKKSILSDKDITVALHSEYDYDELPDEARKEIENFIKYMKDKYKDK